MIDLSDIKNINHLWGRLIIEELRRCGVGYFCISPGSRSAPLVAAVAENKLVEECVHYDERGLAFHALGYASSTGNPACIIVTSGTAVGNCFPAVIEASKKKVPLIVLTADRPPELRNTGANQTIDQVKIYGDYARFHFDMPCPSIDIPPQMVLTTIGQAVYRSKGGVAGPVHINCMFREPLAPIEDSADLKRILDPISQWVKEELPFTNYILPQKSLSKNSVNDIVSELKKINKGIIIVGKLKSEEEQKCVLKIAQRFNWPVFPDITSGLRLNGSDNHIIRYFDQVLLDTESAVKYAPDGILHLGGRMTSKRLYDFIEKANPEKYITVLNHPLRNDPLHKVTLRVESGIPGFCNSIQDILSQRENNSYVSALKKASDKVYKTISEFNSKQTSFNIAALIDSICSFTREKTGLFLASSMSIRHMDMFACQNENLFVIGSNRGASGIDGTIATACGFAKGIKSPCVLLLGDLAFLHDLNSLSLVKFLKYPFVIIVLNDDGGGIFSFLPIASFPQLCEKYFCAPHGLSFEMAAKMFGINYYLPKSNKDFADCYKKALKKNSPAIIEIVLNRADNLKRIKLLQNKIISSLNTNTRGDTDEE